MRLLRFARNDNASAWVDIALQTPGLGEGAEAAVVSFFYIVREAAAGQLLNRQMIPYTFAA